MTLKLRITIHSTHPHFGGTCVESWDYELAEFSKAEAHYKKAKEDVGTSGYAYVEISIVHVH